MTTPAPTPPQRILVVEDEQAIADVLVEYLRHAGFAADHVADGLAALGRVRSDPPDLAILDIMLPGMDGVQLCREIRQFTTLPIIMVTARVDEIDRLLGLEVGADDYICKPFSPREVIARVASALRRVAWTALSSSVQSGRVDIDDTEQRIAIDNCRLPLTTTEFRLLKLLSSHPGRVYSRGQILDFAYNDDQEVSDRIIDSHIKNIRKKIAAAIPGMEVVHAVYGVGYRFEFQV